MSVTQSPTTILKACWRAVHEVSSHYSVRLSSNPSEPGAETDTEQYLPDAVKWILDHYRFLESQIGETRDALPRRVYRALSRHDHESNTIPWIHVLARDLVQRLVQQELTTGGVDRHCLDTDNVVAYFEAAQAQKALCLAELWAIKPLIKLSLLEILGSSLVESSEDSAHSATVAQSVVTKLYTLDELPWQELTESLSSLDDVLRLDPASVYQRMDFETRDTYRRAVEDLARRSALSEEEIGRLAIELAYDACRDDASEEPTDHVGYYLVGRGVGLLEARARCTTSMALNARRAVERWAGLLYPACVAVVTTLIVAALAELLRPVPRWFWLLLMLPAAHAAVAIVNRIVTASVPPRKLPRLDFSDGVPDDCRTFVVVPALLLSRGSVDVLLERLEIHYLANRDPNLRFALLTDGQDAAHRTDQDDLAQLCRERIERLNERYADDESGPFYVFHRGRRWNERECVWMGHERKRGKLNDFNSFLLGGPDGFEIKTGDLSRIRDIRYVITLDADTQLPLDTARHLIGTAAHPLNRPIVDARSNTVRQGYAILQPRIGVSMASTERSRFAALQSGAVGFDPYTTAVSDVYQDLCGQASFTGKGLYDLRAFHRAVADRFPDNTLLSHDLIEGEHARVGLATDVEFLDDYPGSYEAYSKRKHRWIRGDWQLVRWLLPRVAHASGARVDNPLSLVSRWKILDNLRRSTLEAAVIALLVFGWRTGYALATTIGVTVLLSAGCYIDLLIATWRLPPRKLLRSHVRATLARFGQSHMETLAFLIFLPHQALITTDAIVRALARQFITRRRLLEWESMAQAESRSSSVFGLVRRYLCLTPVAACALLAGFWPAAHAGPAIAATVVWTASPWVAKWLDRRPSQPASWSSADLNFLRDVALRTWRYFLDWSRPDSHWLVPDNIDESSGRVAYRTSPTNIGLQLGAAVAAHDFGYLTQAELSAAVTRVLDTLDALEVYRGHFFNWYDTRTLEPLPPRYVSSVDSGNLCVSLLITKHACVEALNAPIVSRNIWDGLRDHCALVQRALPSGVHPPSLRAIWLMLDGRAVPDDSTAWLRCLRALRPMAVETIDRLATLRERRASRRGNDSHLYDDARYWSRALLARIDDALRALDTFVPFIETPLSSASAEGPLAQRLQEVDEAARRVPMLADSPAHYERLEEAARECLTFSAGMCAETADRISAFIEQTADARAAARRIITDLQTAAERASRFAERTDFTFLFDSRHKLLRVGYNADAEQLEPSCYGLLASEARTAVFLAIAKRDIPRDAWFHLGRKLTSYRNCRTLVSWSGTMFEYAMPTLFMKSYDNTLLGASIRRAVRIQQLYGRELGIPWGMSEAAYSACDDTHGRRYQAFGVPDLAMKRMRPTDVVVAPYATLLALSIDRAASIDNLRSMASRGWLSRFGFYESIDCRHRGVDRAARSTIVPLFMAHHQGMSLMALDNAVFDNAMQRRFHTEPVVITTELLLQERLPALIADGDMGVLPSEIPMAPHLQLVARPEREIAPISEGSVMPAA